ncbi:MAG: hypothetical protein ABGX47_21130 [Martelella sp.]|tara:strand:+ start:512 stop:634 length:123 start_codon:yes stop_codon:yes gene_type:complete
MVAPIVLVRDRNGIGACRGDTGQEYAFNSVCAVSGFDDPN